MPKINYFFKKKEFKSTQITSPYYEYRGYYYEIDGEKIYPIILYFGKNEMVFCYRFKKNIKKIFVLPIMDGEINQERLSRKIENYWKMPLWKPEDSDDNFFYIDKSLLKLGYYNELYGFDFNNNNFKNIELFDIKEEDDIIIDNNLITLIYNNRKKDENISRYNLISLFIKLPNRFSQLNYLKNKISEKIEIITNYINFQKLFVDFLYELTNANTFEDKNFFILESILLNNKVAFGLLNKCKYYDELYKLNQKIYKSLNNKEYDEIYISNQGKKYLVKKNIKNNSESNQIKKLNQKIIEFPKTLIDAEKEWLNICFLPEYEEIFNSQNSIFKTREEEVELVTLKAKIGDKLRKNIYSKSDYQLRNNASSFFLRNYSILKAVNVIWSKKNFFLIICLLLLSILSDFLIYKFFPSNNDSFKYALFPYGVPLILGIYIIYYYYVNKINLFKLILPRLSFGILMGWIVFSSGEELWKKALLSSPWGVIISDFVFIILILLYVFTDIRNKLSSKIPVIIAFYRSCGLVFFSMVISAIIGFYIISMSAQPFLENSGLVNDIVSKDNNKIVSLEILNNLDNNSNIIDNLSYSLYKKYINSLGSKKFLMVKWSKYDINIIYCWSILFSEFVSAILIGVVLQFLWEDRPITEPL